MYSAIRWICVFTLVSGMSLTALGETQGDGRDEHPVVVSKYDVISAHYADGQNWSTEFVFVNLSRVTESATLYFSGSDGELQYVTLKDRRRVVAVDFTLPPFGSFRIETLGEGRRVTQGSVFLGAKNVRARIGGTAIFRRKIPGIPTYEASVPFENLFHKKAYLPFDHRNGYTSGIAVVNSALYESMTLGFDFYDESGRLIDATELTLPAENHRAFSLTDEVSSLIGRVGMMVVSIDSTQESLISFQILGLRFNPDGPFTTISPMLSVAESTVVRE